MEQIIDVLKTHNVLDQVSAEEIRVFTFDKRPQGQVQSQKNQRFSATISMQLEKEKVDAVREALGKLPFEIQTSQQLGVGQKMPHYTGFHKVYSEEKSDLVHQNGQVLLVDVWATWCGPCQNPMKHNQEMLQKNQEKWKGKVRIVAVSVDQDKQTIVNRINSKGWNKIQHLTLLGWNGNHPLIQNFQIQGIPFVFLVDKQGKIDFAGHPSSIKLEQRINQLISKQKVEVKQEKKEEKPEDKNITKELQKIGVISKALSKQVLVDKFGKEQLFSLFSKTNIKLLNGTLSECKATIKVAVFKGQDKLIDEFKSLFAGVDQNSYTIEPNLVEFVQVPKLQNPQCADCKGKLTYPYYWCKWDTTLNTFRCQGCVQKKPADPKSYSYKQNSILLSGPWKKIAVKSLGSNIQPQSIDKVQAPNQFGCNGCGSCPSDIGVARYVCLACRADPNYRGDYIDICEECLSLYCKGDQQKRTALNVDGHKQNHPLLRVLYNVQGYYTF